MRFSDQSVVYLVHQIQCVLAFLAPAHLGKCVESISVVGAPIGQILLPPMIDQLLDSSLVEGTYSWTHDGGGGWYFPHSQSSILGGGEGFSLHMEIAHRYE
jgi:hypothetical protein